MYVYAHFGHPSERVLGGTRYGKRMIKEDIFMIYRETRAVWLQSKKNILHQRKHCAQTCLHYVNVSAGIQVSSVVILHAHNSCIRLHTCT